MNLSRYGREHYDVKPTTDPPIAAWEASFDRGVTWVPGSALTGEDTGWFRWLLAGPDAEKGEAVAVLPPGTCSPLARGVDDTEIVVRGLPSIYVD